MNGLLKIQLNKCHAISSAQIYSGSVGALVSMGAFDMGLPEDLQPLVNAWRNSNPMITAFWWDVDRAIKTAITQRVKTEVRDILYYTMKTLWHCFIVGHVHDERIIECDPHVDLKAVCEQMGRSLDWMPDILLRANGYETDFNKKG